MKMLRSSVQQTGAHSIPHQPTYATPHEVPNRTYSTTYRPLTAKTNMQYHISRHQIRIPWPIPSTVPGLTRHSSFWSIQDRHLNRTNLAEKVHHLDRWGITGTHHYASYLPLPKQICGVLFFGDCGIGDPYWASSFASLGGIVC